MRGWSCRYFFVAIGQSVIPANAGVILTSVQLKRWSMSYPRECGGDPDSFIMIFFWLLLSPRMRGWSYCGKPIVKEYDVIPANAGVILSDAAANSLFVSYPRECGGDPEIG